MPTLNLYFNGMCAFVPERGGREMTVLLPNLKDYDGPIQYHHPALLFLESAVVGYMPSRCDPIPGNTVPGICSWDLSFESIEMECCGPTGCISLPGRALSVDRSSRPRDASGGYKYRKPKNRNEVADFSWVPGIGPLSGTPGQINPDLMQSSTRAEEVIGRLKLTSGRLSCIEMAHELPKMKEDIYEYQFKENGATFGPQQALAELAKLEVHFAHQLRFVARSLDDPDRITGSVVLEASGLPPTLHAALVNVPEVSGPPNGPRPTGHFRRFYDLLSQDAPSKPIPVREEHSDQKLNAVAVPDILKPVINEKKESIRNEKLCPFVQFAEYSP